MFSAALGMAASAGEFGRQRRCTFSAILTANVDPIARRWSGVERVTFHNADTGFAVLKVKARGRRDLVPLVGHAASISAGEYVHAVGVWATDRTHGLQFKADLLKTTPPTTKEGIARYLGSGMVRGIGPKLAERIVGQFGLDTFEVIEARKCSPISAKSRGNTSSSFPAKLLIACFPN